MTDEELEKYYLCVIAAFGKINSFEVGRHKKDRESFSFSNGPYAPTVLYRKPVGGNATYVISATPLSEIADSGLLVLETEDE